jgi:hypothetical protein
MFIRNSVTGDRTSVDRMIRHCALQWGGGELATVCMLMCCVADITVRVCGQVGGRKSAFG